jgi:hypothetical protein
MSTIRAEAESEEIILAAGSTGNWANCRNGQVRAEFLQAIILESISGFSLHVSGLRIENAQIRGLLDLDGCAINKLIVFRKCSFAAHSPSNPSISLADATIRGLGVNHCHVAGDIAAPRLIIDRDFHVFTTTVTGQILLAGSRLRGRFFANNSSIGSLDVEDAEIGGNLMMEGVAIKNGIVLRNAEIGGNFSAKPAPATSQAENPTRSSFAGARFSIDATGILIKNDCILTGALTDGPVLLRGGKIAGRMNWEMGILRSNFGACLVADDLVVDGDCLLSGIQATGGVRFQRARIGGRFAATEIATPEQKIATPQFVGADYALDCESATIARDISLSRASFVGKIVLRSASVGGFIWANRLEIKLPNSAGQATALDAEDAVIGKSLVARSMRVINGHVTLQGAEIKGRMILRGLVVNSRAPSAIYCQRVRIGDDAIISDALIHGKVALDRASITGTLKLARSYFRGRPIAIDASQIRIGNACDLAGSTINGGLSLKEAAIGGSILGTPERLSASRNIRTRVINTRGPSINAERASVRGEVRFEMAKLFGPVQMTAAVIDKQISFRLAKIVGCQTGAFVAFGARFGESLRFEGRSNEDGVYREYFDATGALILDRAEIKGNVRLEGARLTSGYYASLHNRPIARTKMASDQYAFKALSLKEASAHVLTMPDSTDTRPLGAVDLSHLRVNTFEDNAAAWLQGEGTDVSHLALDGFVYGYLKAPGGFTPGDLAFRGASIWKMRLRWLKTQPTKAWDERFTPQPWKQLSACLRAQGLNEDAKRLAIDARQRARRRGGWDKRHRLLDFVLDKFAGYGFQPGRAAVWMAAVILIFAALWSVVGELSGKSEQGLPVAFVENEAAPLRADGTTKFNSLLFSAETFFRFVRFNQSTHFIPNARYRPLANIPKVSWSYIASTAQHCYCRSVGLLWGLSDSEIDCPTARNESSTLTVGDLLFVAWIIEECLGLLLASLFLASVSGLLRRME